MPGEWMCWDCSHGFETRSEYVDHFENYTICDECGECEDICPMQLDLANVIENLERQHMRNEHPSSTPGPIYMWDYRPEFEPRGSDRNWFVGIELEICADTNDASALYEWSASHGDPGLFYAKQDGSVQGFEIVTHPMTPGFFRGFDWEGFMGMLDCEFPTSAIGYTEEPDSHGLHVHVSRDAFTSNSHLAAWNYFLHHNNRQTSRMARRTRTRWAHFSPTPVRDTLTYRGNEWEEIYVSRMCDLGHDHGTYVNRPIRRLTWFPNGSGRNERYSVVNLQNDDTVEFRLGRSTRNPDDFRRTVEFVASSVDYIATLTHKHADTLSWEAYGDYVANDPYLARLINNA